MNERALISLQSFAIGSDATPLEVACHTTFGSAPAPEWPAVSPDPLAALEHAIAPAIERSPCLVSFSGGFDSSLVLSVAARRARRLGLPDPIPITWRFTDAPKAHESEWQELVVANLRLADWQRLEVRGDELDLIGPVAQRTLTRHGLLYPANTYMHEPFIARARGGSLLTGIGGDQLLGDWRGRALADLLARRRGPRPLDPLRIARACSPRLIRVAYERTRVPEWGWLSRPAREQAARMLARDAATEPFTWSEHLRWQLSRRDRLLGHASLSLLAREAGSAVVNPLFDPGFAAALARAGGRLGFGERRATIAALFGDLLPPRLFDRPRKAVFSQVLWGRLTRELMRSWDGSGLDETNVDPDGLRAEWCSERPDSRTALLVQQAWLARIDSR